MTLVGIVAVALVAGWVLGRLRRAAMARALNAGTGGGYSITVMFVALGVLVAAALVLVANDVAMREALFDAIGGKR